MGLWERLSIAAAMVIVWTVCVLCYGYERGKRKKHANRPCYCRKP